MPKFPKYLDTYSFGVCRDCEPGVNQHPPTHHATTYLLASSSHQVPYLLRLQPLTILTFLSMIPYYLGSFDTDYNIFKNVENFKSYCFF